MGMGTKTTKIATYRTCYVELLKLIRLRSMLFAASYSFWMWELSIVVVLIRGSMLMYLLHSDTRGSCCIMVEQQPQALIILNPAYSVYIHSCQCLSVGPANSAQSCYSWPAKVQ